MMKLWVNLLFAFMGVITIVAVVVAYIVVEPFQPSFSNLSTKGSKITEKYGEYEYILMGRCFERTGEYGIACSSSSNYTDCTCHDGSSVTMEVEA